MKKNSKPLFALKSLPGSACSLWGILGIFLFTEELRELMDGVGWIESERRCMDALNILSLF
jgi:hypothetical protein